MKGYIKVVAFAAAITLTWSLAFMPGVQAADKKITVWMMKTYVPEADKVLEKQMMEWGKQNGVEVVLETYTIDQMATKYTVAIEGKTLPDVAELATFGPSRLHSLGRLEDVSDVVADIAKELGEPHADLSMNMKFDGKFYAVPQRAQLTIMFYRTDLLEKMNLDPPKTWSELWEQCKKIKEARLLEYPAGFPWNRTGDGQEPAMAILWSNGVSWCDKDGYYKSINVPEGVRAIETMVQPYRDGTAANDYLSWTGAGNNEAYLAEKIAFTGNGMSIIWQLNNFKHPLKDKTMVAPYPAAENGQRNHGSVGIQSLAVPTDSQNKDLAKSLIRYLMKKENINEYLVASVKQCGPLFANLEKMEYWQDALGKAVIEELGYLRQIGWPGPATGAASEVLTSNVLTDMATRVIVDKIEPAEALKEADAKIKAIYERHKLVR